MAVVVALATIPVGHTLYYSAGLSGTGTTVHAVFDWAWSFPSGVNVTVSWSGPAGAVTNLSVLGVMNGLFSQSGTSGKFSFTSGPLPYAFQMTVDGVDVQGEVRATASYQAPVL